MNLGWTIVVMSVLTVGNYWVKRSVLFPPFIFSSVWLLVIVLDRLNLVETNTIHPATLGFVTAGAVLFTAGGLLALLAPSVFIETRLIVSRFPQRNKLVHPLLILFLLCGIPMQIQNLRALAAHGEGGTLLARARSGGIAAMNNGEAVEGMAPSISVYFVFWTLYTTIIFMLERRGKLFWFMVSFSMLVCILTTGRTTLLQLFSSLICVHLLMSGRTGFWAAVKVARIPVFIFLFLYVALIFVNKGAQAEYYGNSMAEIAMTLVVAYIVGPLAALDTYLQNPAAFPYITNHTFKLFLGAAARLHLVQYTPPPLLDEFTGVPYPVNVYTMYKPYISDFGITGALIFVAIIGFLHVLLYRKAITGSFLGMLLFSLTIFPAAMAIFDDQYAAFGNYINVLLFGAIYLVLQSLPVRVLPQLRDGYGVPP
jgi:oligosaccharide repeat unit polymerase